MLFQIGLIICALVIGFIETYFYMCFAARLAEYKKETGITNLRLTEAREAFTKGNSYTKHILESEWSKFKWCRRLRISFFSAFVLSIFFVSN
ncbi:hypothetical protein CWB98_00310 [Pseudoalteromonas rubra]|uniref:Uncharacterized protein n=1 Tax=Pseudoalteromonas rubra TaxID=43658 RepID=A0A5S3X659_9GAMM|nr:hypothetical protein CWB98_00310 [Pseudoalteromonas rubra]